MQITEITPFHAKKDRFLITLDEGNSFVLYRKELSALDLSKDSELSIEQYELILSETLIPRAKRRAMYLLQKTDRSEKNLRRKLKEGGYPPEAVDAAIAYVSSYHYIDDERMACAYVRVSMEKKSRQRIRQDLMGKGIDAELIERALEEEFTMDEETQIQAWLEKKNYRDETADRKEREKMIRFLASKGYGMSDILHVIREP